MLSSTYQNFREPLTTKVVRRAIQHGFRLVEKGQAEDVGDWDDDKHPRKKLIALTVVIVLGSIGYFLLEYIASLIMKLTIVEAEPSVTLPDDAERVPLTQGESRVVPGKYVTASLPGTLKLLREKLGFWGPFHGFGADIIFVFAISIATTVIDAITSSFLSEQQRPLISAPLSAFVTATISIAVTHAQVGMGGPGINVFTRTGGISFQKAAPTFLSIFFIYASFDIVYLVAMAGTANPASIGILIAVFSVFTLYVKIVLIRQQASGLPSEEESVVKLDRAFGQEVEGDRILTFQEASQGVSKDFVRIFVMAVKVYGVVIVYCVAWVSAALALDAADLWKKM